MPFKMAEIGDDTQHFRNRETDCQQHCGSCQHVENCVNFADSKRLKGELFIEFFLVKIGAAPMLQLAIFKLQ